MKIQKFNAATAREALTMVREALGPDALIISNRNTETGVEILASAESDFETVIAASQSASKPTDQTNTSAPTKTMSDAYTPNEINLIIDEIRAMRGSVESQLALLNWNDQIEKHPAKAKLFQELLAMGFSAGLSRYLTEHVPDQSDLNSSLSWAQQILSRNLSVMENEADLLDQGGIYALVGPTGVGKTTTTAKLAARCVMRHGASKLALITTDSYRIGAHEQLRIYGKILGVMVHAVRDEADLRIALDELTNKHTVLIDTVGMSQRDQMVSEQIAMLSGSKKPIKRLLCLNSTSTIETLNEVVNAYQGSGLTGCILTKLDEAVTLSNALDVLLRQKLKLFYLGTGQRVPEDLELAYPAQLVEKAFEHRNLPSASRYQDHELPNLMIAETAQATPDLNNIHVS